MVNWKSRFLDHVVCRGKPREHSLNIVTFPVVGFPHRNRQDFSNLVLWQLANSEFANLL